jgi:hypothetical protein
MENLMNVREKIRVNVGEDSHNSRKKRAGLEIRRFFFNCL